MELTIKHLAPYLPYGLTGIINGKIVTVDTMHQHTLQSEPRVHGYTYCEYHKFKPLLYPLSCLTEEITVDGKTFVPIVELAKIGAPRTYKHEWDLTHRREDYPHGIAAPSGEAVFIFKDGNFVRFYKTYERAAENQLLLFQKLYEWHFDLYSILDNGLAIDKRKHLNR